MSFISCNFSLKLTRDLKEKQDLLNLPQNKLKGHVTTRWGSTYDMVSCVIEQQQAISTVLLEYRKHCGVLCFQVLN